MELLATYDGVHGYIASVVCTVGIIANLVNIVVLTRRNMLTAVNVLLTALAAADACIMAVYLPVAIVYLAGQASGMYFVSDAPEKLYYVLFFASFSSTCHSVAIWQTIAVASFRVLCLCCPARGKRICSRRSAWAVTGAIVAGSFLVTIPNWLTLGIVSTDHVQYVASVRRCPLVEGQSSPPRGTWTVGSNELAMQNESFLAAAHWLVSIACRIVPSIALAVLTVMLLYIVHNAEVRRQALQGSNKSVAAPALRDRPRSSGSQRGRRENPRTTFMLLAVVCLFLLVELPHGAMIIAKSVSPPFEDIYNHLGNLIDLTVLVALSLNFFLYTAMSKQFRCTFAAVFCKRWQTMAARFGNLSCNCQADQARQKVSCNECRRSARVAEVTLRPCDNALSTDKTEGLLTEHESIICSVEKFGSLVNR